MKEHVTTLLVNPPTPSMIKNKEYILPPALLYLGGYLKASGKEVEILDFNIYKPWEMDAENPEKACFQTLINKITEIKPSLIGFGCLFSGQFLSVLEFAKITKEHFPGIPIVVGGMHATLFAREILTHVPFIDYVILGEGESQLLALVRYLNKEIQDIRDIPDGLAYRTDQEIIIKPKQTYFQNLDTIPFPAYEQVNFDDYKHDTAHWHNPKGLQIGTPVPIISSRSCPCQCNFCSMYLVGGSRFRHRTAENVVAEMELLYEKYHVRHFSFMDDNLTFSKKRTIEICDQILKRNLNVQFETLNGLYVRSLDQDVIDALVSAGWVRGALAIESGSDYIRNIIIKKNISKEKVYEIVGLIKKYPQVYVKAYFIIGMPEDTNETLMETYNMINDLNIDEPTITNVVPFPGTKLFDQCVRDRLFIDDVDLSTLWKDNSFYLTNNQRFFLKPYKIELEELKSYRTKLDQLLTDKQNLRKSKVKSYACTNNK